MRIESEKFRIEIDDSKLAVTSIFNKITNEEYVKSQCVEPLFYLYGFDGKTKLKLLPKLIKTAENTLFTQFGERQIFGEISFETRGLDKLAVKISMKNNDENFVVCETVGVNLYGLSLDKDYTKNTLIYPHHAGEKIENVIDEYENPLYKTFFRAFVFDSDIGTNRREINYCGLASMSFMYLYNERNGLYIGSHDLSFPVTGLIADTGKNEKYVGLSFRKHYDFKCGETYDSGEYVIAINDKDWHAAKEIYRDYIANSLIFHNYPDYLDDEWGLNQCYNFKRQNVIEHYFKDIPSMFEKGKEVNLSHMFIASWNRTGFDSDYPEYYPDLELGSAMDFCRGLQYIREHGGIPTLYINARIFDVKDDFHKTLGEKMAIRQSDGSPIIETYGPETFTVNCPSDDDWRDRLTDTAEFCIKGYGATGIYLDQLGSAEPFPCYNKAHSHKHIGEFNNGYVRSLTELHDRITKFNDKSFILTENIGDIYGSYTFGNLTWNSPEYAEFYNLIKYIFPEFVQINMCNPRKYFPEWDKKVRYFYNDLERAVLLGSVMWWAGTAERDREYDEMIAYGKTVLKFREAIQPMVKGGTFLDGDYLLSKGKGQNVTFFESEKGLLTLIGNVAETDFNLQIKLP
ncbi:MAG: DUF6259 domain-containing protein, partial [Clostridia bacterium]